MTSARPVFLLTLAAAGCIDAPAWDTFPKPSSSASDSAASSTSTVGGELPTTGGGIMTTTVDVDSTSTAADTTSGPGTTAAPVEPLIVGHILGPDPLQLAGPIAVSIATENADGVRMQVDDGSPVELESLGADTYAGEILMVSALSNGTHSASFTAWRDGIESEPLEVAFEVALPPMGSEAFWESAALIGKGSVAALATTPGGELLEFGTFYPVNEPRCYLRRRDLGGAWSDDDFFVVLPDVLCVAVDMKVSAAGEIFTLADRMDNGDTRWTLGKQATWGGAVENIGQGAIGETAHALALHPDMVAVCGGRPQPTLDLDAFAAIFRPNQPGLVKTFDYVDPSQEPQELHKFDETARDCVFLGDALALVGEAFGKHDGENPPERDRLFVLELAPNTLEPTWTVALPGPGTHSGATAVTVDDGGRLVLAAYTCAEPCEPEGALRLFTPGAGLGWPVALGLGVGAPFDVAWHPGGYAVVVGSLEDSPVSTVFWTQAWLPGANQPLWTAEHTDAPALQLAMAVAVGAYGHVFAGGVGALGYPALAYING